MFVMAGPAAEVAAMGGAATLTALWMRPRKGASAVDDDVRIEPVHTLLPDFHEHAWSPHALISVRQPLKAWRRGALPGGIAYSVYGRTWLAASDPIAPVTTQQSLMRLFADDAEAHGAMAVFAPMTERGASIAERAGLHIIKIGASPYFDLPHWDPRGDIAKHLRSSVNRARRAGLVVQRVETLHQDRDCAHLCQQWLASRPAGKAFGWLFALHPHHQAATKRFFVARDGQGRMAGLLAASPIPARNGWYLEDVIRDPAAPQGVCDLLVFEALCALREQGAATATLGTALFAQDGADVSAARHHWPRTRPALQMARRQLCGFYNFDGLRNFKNKFVPTRWEGEYAAASRKTAFTAPRAITAIARAVLTSE